MKKGKNYFFEKRQHDTLTLVLLLLHPVVAVIEFLRLIISKEFFILLIISLILSIRILFLLFIILNTKLSLLAL